MRCPDNVANALLEILRISLLRIRNHAWSGRADRCAIEADHIHNIPQLLRNFRPELLEYYLTVERPFFIRQSAAAEVAEYEAAWDALRASTTGTASK